MTIWNLLKISLTLSLSGCTTPQRGISMESLCHVNLKAHTCNTGRKVIPIGQLDTTQKWYMINNDDLTSIYILTIENK